MCGRSCVTFQCLIALSMMKGKTLILCYPKYFLIMNNTNILFGAHSNIVVKALCYKLEGRGFDTR
jgi:hypothetical protein